ncbi:hypothetical protein DL762_006791 [Monosporascus cannonballus]|uniref:Ig-like domain-containing protein n=1 Tax=Monosporascus cannonballus TaxID=155416 RepID=A0ABY0H120_9PEZI|nr:hypothetical protein DL762_006791 [Monosporascus cannonballus]
MWRPTDCSVPVGIAFLVLSSVAQFTSAAIFVTKADSSSSRLSHSLGGIDHFRVVYRRYTNNTTLTSTDVTTSTAISVTLGDTLSSITQSGTSTSTGSDTSAPRSRTIPSSTVTTTSLTTTSTLVGSTTTTSIPSPSLTLTSPPTETSAALAQATSSASSVNSEVAILIPIIQSWTKDPESLKTYTLDKVNNLVDGVEDAIFDLGGDEFSGCDSNKKRGLLDLVSDVVNTLACILDDLTEITDKINIDDVVGITPALTDLTTHNDDLEDKSEDDGDDDDETTTDERETTETKSDPSTTATDSGTTTTVSSEPVTSTTSSGSCKMRETTRLEPPTNTVPTVTVDLPTVTASGETSTGVTSTTSDTSSFTTSGATSEIDTASDTTSGAVSTTSGTASMTTASTATASTTFSTTLSGTTITVSSITTTTSALATTTEAAPFCIPYQNPHKGDSYCQCSSGDLSTTLPMDTGRPPCQYTAFTVPPTTTAPPVTQDPYTFTDPLGNVIACPTWNTFGVGSDITVTTCEEPSSTIFTAGPTGEAKLCGFTGDTLADANCFLGICGRTRHDHFSNLIIPGPDNESGEDDTLLWEDTETDPTEHQPWEFAKDSIGIQEDFSFSWDNGESCSCSVDGESVEAKFEVHRHGDGGFTYWGEQRICWCEFECHPSGG